MTFKKSIPSNKSEKPIIRGCSVSFFITDDITQNDSNMCIVDFGISTLQCAIKVALGIRDSQSKTLHDRAVAGGRGGKSQAFRLMMAASNLGVTPVPPVDKSGLEKRFFTKGARVTINNKEIGMTGNVDLFEQKTTGFKGAAFGADSSKVTLTSDLDINDVVKLKKYMVNAQYEQWLTNAMKSFELGSVQELTAKGIVVVPIKVVRRGIARVQVQWLDNGTPITTFEVDMTDAYCIPSLASFVSSLRRINHHRLMRGRFL